MTPRLLFLDHTGALGGGELSLLDIARHYRDTATVALLADGPFRARLADAGIDVVVVETGVALSRVRRESAVPNASALVSAARVARKVAELARGHDVIYANSQKAFVIAAAAGVLARRHVVWHLRDILDRSHFSGPNVRAMITLANRVARRVIANSRATASAFVAAGGRADRVAVVYNGVDSTPFESAGSAGDHATRGELGLPDAPVVGAFGRFAPWKGQHVMLEALVHLPGVHALFVGDALFAEQEYAVSLHRRAHELGVADRAHFLGFRTDVPRLMRAVDVVAHTSVAPEPFGRVILEGMLAGRPVVATRGGGAVEIVTHAVNGVLVPPGDPGALASAVAALIRDRDAARTLAEAGRRHALERFAVGAMLDGVDRQVRDVVRR